MQPAVQIFHEFRLDEVRRTVSAVHVRRGAAATGAHFEYGTAQRVPPGAFIDKCLQTLAGTEHATWARTKRHAAITGALTDASLAIKAWTASTSSAGGKSLRANHQRANVRQIRCRRHEVARLGSQCYKQCDAPVASLLLSLMWHSESEYFVGCA